MQGNKAKGGGSHTQKYLAKFTDLSPGAKLSFTNIFWFKLKIYSLVPFGLGLFKVLFFTKSALQEKSLSYMQAWKQFGHINREIFYLKVMKSIYIFLCLSQNLID